MKKLFAMLLAFTMCAALTPGMDAWAYAEGTAHGDIMYTPTAAAPAAPSGMQWVMTGKNTNISMECAKPEHTHSIEQGCYALKSADTCHVHSSACYTHVHDEGCCSMENQICGMMCGLLSCGITYQHVHDPECIDGIGNTHAKQIAACNSDACTNIPNRLSCTKTEKECDDSCYDTSTPICSLEAHTHGNCSTVASSYRWQLVDSSALKAGDVLATANGSEPAVTPQGYRWVRNNTQTASASLQCGLEQHVHSIAGGCTHTCSGHVHTDACKTAHVHTAACCMYAEYKYDPTLRPGVDPVPAYYHKHDHEHEYFTHNDEGMSMSWDVCSVTQYDTFTKKYDTVWHMADPGCRNCVYANCNGQANASACGEMEVSHTPDCISNFTCTQPLHKHTQSCFNIGYASTEWKLVAASFSITCENSANGAVTADKNPATVGEPVTLTIIPAEDYELDTLTVRQGETEVTISGTGNSRTFTMPVGDVTVSATFKHICDEDIDRITGQAATCTQNGWQDYYQCSVCKTTYTDADGTTKITDLDAWKNGDGKIPAAHSPTYTANGNVITESCSACTVELGTVTILAENAAYTGAPYEEDAHITVTATGTLKDRDWPIGYIAISGSLSNGKPVNAGSYSATVTVEENETSLSAGDDFTITPISIENAVVTVADFCTYDGTEKRPTTVMLNGYSVTEDDFEIVGYSSNINAGTDTATITIRGKGNYTGEATGSFTIAKAAPTAANFTMTPPGNLHYTGETKAATVAAASGVTGMGEITVRYSPENPVNNGAYQVLINVEEGENYTAVTNLNVGSFIIGQSGSAFSDVKTYLGDAEKNEFTYGQTVTVRGNVQHTGEAPAQSFSLLRAFDAPAAKQVALFDAAGTTQLSAAAAVGADGAFELTYDTTAKLVDPAASVTLMVKYVGDGNMANANTTIAIRLNACPVAPALSGSVTKPYDGTADVPAGHGLSIQLNGLQSSDSVSVTGSFAYEEAVVGTGKTVTASGIALGGMDAKFYALSADTASGACGEITKAQAVAMSGATHVINNHAQTYEIDLSQYLPALDGGRTFGSVSYALDGVELGSYYDGGAAISGSTLNLPISAVDSDEEKQIGAVTVTVSSQNYADSTLTLAVSTTNHQHQWNFIASGDTITAACSNADGACSVPQVIIQLVAPTDADLAYTGTAKTVTIEQTPAGMFDDLPAVRYCHADGCIGVGEHTAALTYHSAAAELKFVIGPVDTAGVGSDAEIVDGTTLIVTKDAELPDSVAYYGEAAKAALEKKFGATNTVAKIEVHMQEAGEAALAAMGNVNTGTAKTKVLEISLKYWDETSGKWVKITEDMLELVPRKGVEVVIPYSLFGFTDVDNCEQYRFVVQHMITLPMDDAYQIGDIEDLSGESVATAEGLKVHVEHGFSPFVVGYAKVVDQAAIGALPQTGDHSQLGAWLAMLALCGAGMLMLRGRKRRTE